MTLRTTRPELVRPFRVPLGSGFVTKPVMIAVVFLMAMADLAFFRFLLKSTWTNVGAILVVLVCLLWLARVWSTRNEKVWIGTAPVLGIFFAVVMAGPLIEDIVAKAIAGDPIPAILLGGYIAVGAAIYIGYGLRNSRLAQGLDVIEDYAGDTPLEAQRDGVREP